jgi:hypothetical protein
MQMLSEAQVGLPSRQPALSEARPGLSRELRTHRLRWSRIGVFAGNLTLLHSEAQVGLLSSPAAVF